MVFREHYPIAYVPIYWNVDFAFLYPLFILAFYGLKEEEITEVMVMSALRRRKLKVTDFDWDLQSRVFCSDTPYLRKYTPRSYIKRGLGDYYGPSTC